MNFPASTQHILLAVDGSEHAYAAARLVRSLPLPATCRISVVAVLLPRYAQQFSVLEEVLKQTKTLLAEALPNEVHTELLSGDPADQILTYAEAHHPDLIVLGARGRRAAIGVLLGGVAQRVVEYAPCPVLITRAPFNGIRKVLVATDNSESSQFALRHLQDCPLPQGTAVHVIHVLPPKLTDEAFAQSWMLNMEMTAPVITPEMRKQFEQKDAEEQKIGEQLLAETVDALKAQDIPAEGVLRRGDTADEILRYAREQKIDLIVAGSRGLGTFRSLLLGSVSRKLIHYADCSVLIVKPPTGRKPIDILQR